MSVPSATSVAVVAPAAALRVAEVLLAARTVVLVAHIQPDADALGSAFALGLALESLGRDVTVCFDRPDDVPVSLRELPGQHLVRTPVPTAPDLVVTVDVAAVERMGRYARLLDTAGSSVVIDHHASNPGFGAVNWIDRLAEATVVLVTQVIDALQVPLDPQMAANLYAGLVTDTGYFRWSSPAGHRLAARLLEVGIASTEILRPITDSHPYGWLRMLGDVLDGCRLDRAAAGGAGVVLVGITLDQAAGLGQEELDSVVDIIRTVDDAQVAAVLKQGAADRWQVSLRSRAGRRGPAPDVGRVATALGGGGHAGAAGYTANGSFAEVTAALLARLAAG